MQNYIIKASILLFSFVIQAQNPIKGYVLDENTFPLPGASVVNLSSNKGVITDFEGLFSIEANNGDVIELSYVGYLKQSITIEEPFTDDLNFQLVLDNSLDEIVITALGIKRSEKALGYSVQAIKANRINGLRVA